MMEPEEKFRNHKSHLDTLINPHKCCTKFHMNVTSICSHIYTQKTSATLVALMDILDIFNT